MGQHKNWPHFSLHHFPYDDGMSCRSVRPTTQPTQSHWAVVVVGGNWVGGIFIWRMNSPFDVAVLVLLLLVLLVMLMLWIHQATPPAAKTTPTQPLPPPESFYFCIVSTFHSHTIIPPFLSKHSSSRLPHSIPIPKAQLCTTPTVSHFRR